MDIICFPKYSVNYDFHIYNELTLDVSSNCPALNISGADVVASCMTNVNLLYNSMKDSFSIIFDTGASLAISFDKQYFVGPIMPLSNHRFGGLANGLDIEGIVAMKWKFRTKTSVIIVTSSCYYVPNTRARIISSQLLFCEKQAVTDHFLVEKHCATL